MDIASLQIEIDPTKAVSGAKAVKQALDSVVTESEKVDKATTKVGKNDGFTQAGAKAKKGGQEAASGAASFTGAINRTVSGLALLKGALRGDALSMTALFTNMVSSIGGVTRALASAVTSGNGLRGIGAAAASAASGVLTLSAALGGIVLVLGPLIAAFAALKAGFGFLGDSIKAAGEMESTVALFRQLVGEAKQADAILKDMKQLAAISPLSFKDVAEAGKVMMQFGVETKNVMPILERMGDLTAGNSDRFKMMNLAMSQVISNGSLMGQDLLQLTTAGFNPLKTMADKTGESMESLRKKMEKHQITTKMVVQAMDDVTSKGGRAFGTLQTAGETWEGKVGQLADAWERFKVAIGTPIITGLKPLLDNAGDIVDGMTKAAEGMAPAFERASASITAMFKIAQQEGGFQQLLQAGWDWFYGQMMRGFEAAGILFESVMKRAAFELEKAFKTMMTPEFWSQLTTTLIQAAVLFKDALLDAASNSTVGKIVKATPIGMAASAYGAAADYAKSFFEPDLPTGSTSGPDNSLLAPAVLSPGQAWDAATPAVPTTAEKGMYSKISQMADEYLKNAKAAKTIEDKRTAIDYSLFKTSAAEPDKKKGRTSTKKADIVGLGMNWDEASKAAQKLTEDLRTPKEDMEATIARLNQMKDLGLITSDTLSRGIAKANTDYTKALADMAEKTKKAAEAQMSELEKLMAKWKDLAKQIDHANVAIAESIAGNMTDGLVSWMEGTKSAKEAFSDMAKSIISDILRIITRLVVQYAISSALGMAGSIKMPNLGTTAAVLHEGGEVGTGGRSRSVSPAAFTGATKYHSGGQVGLKPGEVPAILEKNEHVLTKEQMNDVRQRLTGKKKADRSERNKGMVTIINADSEDKIRAGVGRSGDTILNLMAANPSKYRRALGVGN